MTNPRPPEDPVAETTAGQPTRAAQAGRVRLGGALARLAAILVGLVAGGHLVAWLTGAMSARGAGVITMKTNTAVCLLLLAAALAMLAGRRAGFARRLAGRLCSGLALVIGVLTLGENLAGWNLGIDLLLASEAPGAMGMASPNRMGSPASVSVLLLGVGLLLHSRQRARGIRWEQSLALAACGVGLLPLIGYLYGVAWLYGSARVSAIAWPTAVSIVVLGAGLLCARPSEGVMAQVAAVDAGGTVVRRLVLPVLLLPIALGAVQLAGQRLGWFDPAMGTALLVLTFVLSLASLTWLAGRGASRAASEMGAQQALLAVTLKSIGDAVLACDAGGRVRFLNPVGADLTGWREEDAIGQPMQAVLRIVDERTGRPADDILARVLGGGGVVGLANHAALLARSGRMIPIEDSAAPMRDASGRPAGAVLVFHDVTEKRRAQDALRLSEEKFAKAFRGNTSIMAITRLRDGVFVDVNDRYVEATGVGRDDLVGRSTSDLNIWQRPEQRAEFVAALRLSGHVHDVEYQFRRPDGREWTGLVSAEVSQIAGEPVIISSIIDITERTQHERGAQEVARLYAVLSKVNETIVRTRDPRALYQDVCRIVAEEGRRPLVWIGLVEGRRVTPVAVAGPAADYTRGLRVETDGEFGRGPTGTSIREDRPVVNDDFDTNPSTAPWRSSAREYKLRASAAFPIRHQGAVVGALTLYATEPGTFDRQQVRLLEALSADLSYALDKMWQETALEESERSLREADRRKDEFLAILSHELRNPLAPIRSGLYILERAVPGGEQATRALAVIDRQVGHLTRLVDDLLDVTRISRGKIRLQREEVDFAELVRRVVEDHRSAFAAANVEIRVSSPEIPIPIQADRTRVAQVVGNLLQNASKFTPAGGTVSVSVDTDPHAGQAIVRVRDTGAGIAPDMLPRIFEPFTQADRTLDRSLGGLGLGLALVKGLVELHHGQVEVFSEGSGRGAEFVVRLPLDRAARVSPESGPAVRSRRPRRVLVIEDNLDAAESLQAALEFGGHAVRVAHDGREGLTAAREFAPEVVLCDIGLPGMDGYEVARALRADPALGGTVLVALSGYALQEDLQRATEAGFHRHLAKPASPEAIERVLADLAPADAG